MSFVDLKIQTDLISLKNIWKNALWSATQNLLHKWIQSGSYPDCYTQPEVQKGREVTTHKVYILIPTTSSVEKYNRRIKLTDKVKRTSISPLLHVPRLQQGRHNCSTTTGKSMLMRFPKGQCLEKLWNVGHLTKLHETTKLFDVRTRGSSKLQWELLFIVTVTTNWGKK